jgi:thioredoxin reductase
VVVVGAGAAGVAAAIEAARAGVEVLLIDENPIDNDMMAMDVPLYFGQRMQASVRNRALMMERVVATNPALAEAHEAGVDVQLGTYVWGAFVNGPTVRELPGPMLGLADDRRSWLVGYDRLIVAAGARDVAMGFPGWERAGAMGANGAVSLLTRYRALASKRMVIVGSGDLGLRTAALALESGVAVAGIVEVAHAVRGDEEIGRSLASRGVPFYTAHTIREARGRVGEIESVCWSRSTATSILSPAVSARSRATRSASPSASRPTWSCSTSSAPVSCSPRRSAAGSPRSMTPCRPASPLSSPPATAQASTTACSPIRTSLASRAASPESPQPNPSAPSLPGPSPPPAERAG